MPTDLPATQNRIPSLGLIALALSISTYAFSTVLTVFLAGIAVGSLVVGRLVRFRDARSVHDFVVRSLRRWAGGRLNTVKPCGSASSAQFASFGAVFW